MGTLGSYLRNAREASGKDIREAAQQTRISVNYLKAIESEEFGKLPGEVFVRGFLKNYARFLHLSEDEVMKRYEALKTPLAPPPGAAAGPQPVEPVRASVAKPAEEERKGGNAEPYLWGGVVLLALLALLFIALAGHRTGREEAKGQVSEPTTTARVVTEATSTSQPGKLYLDLIALSDTWVLVRTDASPQKKAFLKRGDTVTWSADERFLLSYGALDAIKLVLNGRELEATGSPNSVVRDLMITASGIASQRTEPEQPRPRRLKPKPQVPAPRQPAPQSAPAGPAPAAQEVPVPAPKTPTTVPAEPAAPAQ